jgi:peptide/nickel transport system substrate-binding protein
MYSLAWVEVKSQALPLSGANRGRLDDTRVDRMIEQAIVTTDTEQQAAIYAGLQAYLLEQLVYVPLWYEDQYFAARDDIKGYRLATDGNYDALLATIRR